MRLYRGVAVSSPTLSPQTAAALAKFGDRFDRASAAATQLGPDPLEAALSQLTVGERIAIETCLNAVLEREDTPYAVIVAVWERIGGTYRIVDEAHLRDFLVDVIQEIYALNDVERFSDELPDGIAEAPHIRTPREHSATSASTVTPMCSTI